MNRLHHTLAWLLLCGTVAGAWAAIGYLLTVAVIRR